ncbi:MAG: dihydrofolate reductase family protein [Cyanobacteria bacterium P01_H01_bin.153]
MSAIPEFVLYIATSIDGYIASTDGGVDWLNEIAADDESIGYESFYSTIDALIMGATTYEQVLGFGPWPYAGKPTYVLTHRNLSSDRPDIAFKHNFEAVIAAVERQGFCRIWVVGGGRVASEFMNRSLISEVILTIAPIILGDGISLYQDIATQKLQLINMRSLSAGLAELHYRLP